MASNSNKKGLGNQLLTTGFILQPPNRLSLPPIISKHKQYPESTSTSLHTSTQLPCIAKEKPNNCMWSDKKLRHGRPPLSPRKVQELAASINNSNRYSAQLKAPVVTNSRAPLRLQNYKTRNMRNIKNNSQNDSITGSAKIRSLSPAAKLELSPQTGGAFGYNLASQFNKPSSKNNDMNMALNFNKPSVKNDINMYKRSLTPGVLHATEMEDTKKSQMHHYTEETLKPLNEPIDEQRIEMRQKLRQDLTQDTLLETQDYLVNFTSADSTFNALVKKFRGGATNTLEHLTDDIRGDHEELLNEVDEAEAVLACRSDIDYSPRTVLLISSLVPKPDLLIKAAQPGVLCVIYDFYQECYTALLDEVKKKLDEYLEGAKIRSLGIVCKGGPGYMYLLRKKPITPAKLLKDTKLQRFWKTLGSYMSKISNEKSVIHLMESNVAGNKQGEELLVDLEAVMYSHKVKVESPLEIAQSGREMINTYFIMEKFKTWKSRRYTKPKFY